jgi:hypothetical protein
MEGAEPPAVTAASPHGATTLPIDDAGGAPDAERPAPAAAAPVAAQLAAVSSPRAEPAAARGAEASIEDVRRVVAETIKRTSERRAETEAPWPAKEVEAGAAPSLAAAPPVEQAPRRRPGPAPFGLPRALDLKDIAPQHFGAARAEVAAMRGAAPKTEQTEASSGSNRPAPPSAAEPAPSAPAQASPAPARPVAEKPEASPPRRGDDRFNVIGRYESEGTSYVMFADGSIDARSQLGAFHFSSMAELKAFMESQTRGDS